MRVLVTGAAGQMGARLVRQLLTRGHEVTGTILPDDPGRDRLEGLNIERLAGDLRDDRFMKQALGGVDAVLHTANLVGDDCDNTKARSKIGFQPKWGIREMIYDAIAVRAGNSDGMADTPPETTG